MNSSSPLPRWLQAVLLGMLAMILSGCLDRGAAFETSASSVIAGALAPDFTLSDLNGSTVSLSALRGKRVLLNFWATW